MASATPPPGTAVNTSRTPSPSTHSRPDAAEKDTIELIPTNTNRNRSVSLAISETTLQDSTRSGAVSPTFSETTRDSFAGWDNYRVVSLASDTTRNSSGGQYRANGGTRNFSKLSMLSTSRLIADDDPSERAIHHVNRLWTRKFTRNVKTQWSSRTDGVNQRGVFVCPSWWPFL
jgi:hypothetical protein